MEEETTTRYELTEEHAKIHDKMRALMDKPKFIQNYVYHKNLITKIYNARVIVDKPDRISVIDKTFNLRIGTNGLFIKQGTFNSGVTYYKTGRSSSRVKYWGAGKQHPFEQYETLKGIAKEINPDCMDILNSDVIRNVGTQGMYGSIIAGKTDSITKAMEYYIRYSLRGVGIDMKYSMNMYNYLSSMQYGYHNGLKALRVAKDPNAVLSLINDPKFNLIRKLMSDDSSRLVDLAFECSEKIDWTAPGFSIAEETAILQKKSNDISKWLNMWEGGPVLKDKTPTPKATNQMLSASLGVSNSLPF